MIKRNPNLSPAGPIAISLLLSYFLLLCVEPEIFLNHRVSFLSLDSNQQIYSTAFWLTANTFTGGIQLWNPYDQMPLWFVHCTTGLYTYSNLLVALAYRLFSSFFDSPARAFQVLYSIIFFLSFNLMSTLGFFLLLKRFTQRPGVLIFSMVYATTILNQLVYNNGLHCAALFALFPLFIHLLLRFFESWKLDHFLLVLLAFAVAGATSPMMSLSYFYQCAHFFILPAAVWSGIQKFRARRSFVFSLKISREKILKILAVSGLCFFMLLPSAVMLRESLKDLNFDQSNSRLKNVFSVKAYFDQAKNVCEYDLNPPEDLLVRSVDFSRNHMLFSWLFIGYTMVFLVLAGMALNRDSQKYIFLCAALLMWLINAPRDTPVFYFSAAHWLNALTNPLKFMSRAFGLTTAFLMPYILLPVAAMGLESILSLKYFKKRSWIVGFLIGLLFLTDLSATGFYAKAFNRYVGIIPHTLYRRESLGPVVLDYQNPEISPLRNFFSLIPREDPRRSHYIPLDRIGTGGLFFRYTGMDKYFDPPTNYTPVPAAYTRLSADTVLRDHLRRKNAFIYRVGAAIEDKQRSALILPESDLDWEADEGLWVPFEVPFSQARSKTAEQFPAYRDPGPLIWNEIKKADGDQSQPLIFGSKIDCYSFDLPKDFPKYLATCVLTDHPLEQLRAYIGDKILLPAQGRLISAYSFDVQNIKTGRLTVAVPSGFDTGGKKIRLDYRKGKSPGVLSWWRVQPDNLGFDHFTPKDTWVILHWPFDKKWKLWIDGKPAKIYKAGDCFMGFFAEKGSHKILLRYWPDTPLRPLIYLSIFLYCFSMGAVLLKSFQDLKKPFE